MKHSKMLALFLAVVLIVGSIFPTTVFAFTTEKDQYHPITESDNITLINYGDERTKWDKDICLPEDYNYQTHLDCEKEFIAAHSSDQGWTTMDKIQNTTSLNACKTAHPSFVTPGAYKVISLWKNSPSDGNGALGVLYKRGLTYQGQDVDVFVSFDGWDVLPRSSAHNETNHMVPFLAIRDESITTTFGSYMAGQVHSVEYSLHFYKPDTFNPETNTGEEIIVKGIISHEDVDNSESAGVRLNDVEQLYSDKKTYLTVINKNINGKTYSFFTDKAQHAITENTIESRYARITMKFNTSAIHMAYCSAGYEEFADRTVWSNVFGEQTMARQYIPITPNTDVDKKVNGNSYNEITANNSAFSYDITFNVNRETETEHFYRGFSVTDEINELLAVDGVKVFNDEGENITDWFRVTVENNKVVVGSVYATTVGNLEFYGHSYTVHIDVHYIGPIESPEVLEINNTAEIRINDGTPVITVNTPPATSKISTFTHTVKHIDIDDNSELTPAVSRTYISGADYNISDLINKTFPDYKKVSVDESTDENGNITTTVYWQMKDTSLIIKHLNIDTNEALCDVETKTDKIGTLYNTEAKSFEGYHFVKVDGETSGKLTSEPKTVTYYYTANDAQIITHHVDENGKNIAEDVTEDTKWFADYNTSPQTVPNYKLKEMPDNANGIVEKDTVEVTYVYTLKDTEVLVDYITEDGTHLHDTVHLTGKATDPYNTEELSFYGYKLKEVIGEPSGKMKEEPVYVTYVYEKKDASVTVLYVDEKDNPISASVNINAKVGDPYTTEQKTFYSYTFKEVSGNPSGTMTEEPITVKYIYTKNMNTVTINYLEKDTGKVLAKQEIVSYPQGEPYDVAEKTNKPILYYTLNNIEGNVSGIIDKNEIVNVYYTRNQNNIVIEFVDWVTKEVISPIFNLTQDQGTNYDVDKEAHREIKYYTYHSSDGETSGFLTEDKTIHSYYTRNENTITIKYIDKETGKELSNTVVIQAKQGTDYDVTEKTALQIPNYNLVEVTGKTKGLLENDEEIVVYYLVKDAKVVVSYIDDNGNLLAPDETINGKVFKDYTTEEKSFYGYRLLKIEGQPSGKMTEEDIHVTYVYTLRDTKVVANYLDEEGNKIADTETFEGKVFDPYKTEQKEIYGYAFKEAVGETEGTMTEDIITIDYIYSLKPSNLIVNHIDDEGNVLTEPIETTGKVFDEYITESMIFRGYQLIETPENAEGILQEEDTVVTYVYHRIDSKVVVNHLDINGNPLADSEGIDGKIFDTYETNPKEFDLYELTETPYNATGEFGEDTIIVDYIYQLKTGKVVVRFVDAQGNEIADSEILTGYVTTDWDAYAIDIDGYYLTSDFNTKSGKFELKDNEVIFVYDVIPEEVPPEVVETGAQIIGTVIAAACLAGAIFFIIKSKKKN